jgi:hypothetical protein
LSKLEVCRKRETLEQTTVFLRFGAALAIGLLVGLEREYSFIEPDKDHSEHFAGIRTFSLMGVLPRNRGHNLKMGTERGTGECRNA